MVVHAEKTRKFVVPAEMGYRTGSACGDSCAACGDFKSADTDCTSRGTTHCHVRKKQ